MNRFSIFSILVFFASATAMLGCTPRVEVGLPDRPINININAKIDHEVRVKVERDVEDLFSEKKDLF